MTAAHVIRPDWLTRRVINPAVAWLARHGIAVAGSRELAVRGRKSGEWRRTPVNPLAYRGERYLVAPRGHVQWTHNMRAAGGGELHKGGHVERFTASELRDDEKPEILRAYLKKWSWEVGAFFKGLSAKSTDAELLAAAHKYPVFRITALPPADEGAYRSSTSEG
ncbi:nitroreductase family deazaflavin-dependent oxidoreductase [Streptomyces marispadix]|uniref:Nitroreductase family deazaflavin-dependent oxidoreductase n=1 Tax=Streptomyces marispadix TaxID=2922868 RepID=A0ABS9SS23_9ACTN|nr:nitroreductase family deazaflavin-dependent oxidoreductase [Streptomyces marispadix]MCH6159077.1 nitroreductase family deazaflavin-dependent oxidoreductase [Streptomyces marispadix]